MSGLDDAAQAIAQRFLAQAEQALREGTLQRLLLAGPRAEAALQRFSLRPVLIKGQTLCSLVYSEATRDTTRNLPATEALAEVQRLLGHDFANGHLFTPAGELQFALSRKGRASLRQSKAAADAPAAADADALAHNRAKQRWVDPAAPWLQALGVMDAQQRLVPAMARKWKQINKFVEILAGALAASPLAGRKSLRVVDFGSGKGYLTFAVHEHLRSQPGCEAETTGVELRADLVALCNEAAQRAGSTGLRFEQGDVASHALGAVDLMIALHACDIATDHAIHAGIRAGAQVIVCAPCCHKQLRPQLLQPHALKPILQHGVHLGQQAEMLTDTLRALLLQAQGYEAQIFEFVALEHTQKNKMILAVKRVVSLGEAQAQKQQALAAVAQLKGFYGIEQQSLESLLLAG